MSNKKVKYRLVVELHQNYNASTSSLVLEKDYNSIEGANLELSILLDALHMFENDIIETHGLTLIDWR